MARPGRQAVHSLPSGCRVSGLEAQNYVACHSEANLRRKPGVADYRSTDNAGPATTLISLTPLSAMKKHM